MTLHEKVFLRRLKDEIFTTELLNERDHYSNTIWHLAAAYNTLKDIPEHFFTEEALNSRDFNHQTVWHLAAKYKTLKDIPPHVFTASALAQKNKDGDTVWHIAAMFDSLAEIPVHVFDESLANKNNSGQSVWLLIKTHGTIKDVPLHLINKELLNHDETPFNENEQTYIHNVISKRDAMLNDFLATNPIIAKDIDLRDPRLKLSEVKDNTVYFRFEGVKDKISLTKDGVFIKKINHKTLSNAVTFIENNYANIEQSLALPQKVIELENFVL